MTKQMTTANDDNDDDLGVEWKNCNFAFTVDGMSTGGEFHRLIKKQCKKSSVLIIDVACYLFHNTSGVVVQVLAANIDTMMRCTTVDERRGNESHKICTRSTLCAV
jgi:hypothetical protein